jgi:hypothetical protein
MRVAEKLDWEGLIPAGSNNVKNFFLKIIISFGKRFLMITT